MSSLTLVGVTRGLDGKPICGCHAAVRRYGRDGKPWVEWVNARGRKSSPTPLGKCNDCNRKIPAPEDLPGEEVTTEEKLEIGRAHV